MTDSAFRYAEDRDFQLISWGKDRTLKIRPVDVDTLERVGYQRGGPIEGLVSRRGAAYISYASEPEFVDGAGRQPLSDGSALANALMTRDTVMTRGGGSKKSRPVNEDQMEWFMNVHQVRSNSQGTVRKRDRPHRFWRRSGTRTPTTALAIRAGRTRALPPYLEPYLARVKDLGIEAADDHARAMYRL